MIYEFCYNLQAMFTTKCKVNILSVRTKDNRIYVKAKIRRSIKEYLERYNE